MLYLMPRSKQFDNNALRDQNGEASGCAQADEASQAEAVVDEGMVEHLGLPSEAREASCGCSDPTSRALHRYLLCNACLCRQVLCSTHGEGWAVHILIAMAATLRRC